MAQCCMVQWSEDGGLSDSDSIAQADLDAFLHSSRFSPDEIAGFHDMSRPSSYLPPFDHIPCCIHGGLLPMEAFPHCCSIMEHRRDDHRRVDSDDSSQKDASPDIKSPVSESQKKQVEVYRGSNRSYAEVEASKAQQ